MPASRLLGVTLAKLFLHDLSDLDELYGSAPLSAWR
jgi:uncharacterized membrane protein